MRQQLLAQAPHRSAIVGTCLRLFLFLLPPLCLISTGGCLHSVQEDIQPTPLPPPSYSTEGSTSSEPISSQWWELFDDQLLNSYIRQSLEKNFSLQEGYARLKQARLASRQVNADRFPHVSGRLTFDSIWDEEGEQNNSDRAAIALAWELDLWGRLSASAKAADYMALAAEDDLQGLALYLCTEVAETYYRLIEQSLLLDLLNQQVEANETSLNLIKLRFANGAASLVDVYQQEELLASVRAQLPLSKARLTVLQNSLHILVGEVPDNSSLPLGASLPNIPPVPPLGVPGDLLLNRPDLRQLQRKLVAADYRVAEAVADRLPTIRIGGSTALVNGDLILSIFGDALATIYDWGKKKNEVERQRAIVEEKLASYSQRYLVAIKEVEDSLSQERQHEQLLKALNVQLRLAKATLRESRNRYIQGVTDYLPVLAALVSLQNLERNILQRRREHLSYRLHLYRALGTSLLDLEPHVPGSQS